MTNAEKEQRFQFPGTPRYWYGRRLSCAAEEASASVAVPYYTANEAGLSVVTSFGSQDLVVRIPTPSATPHTVSRFVSDRSWTAWSELGSDGWRIRLQEDRSAAETVFETPDSIPYIDLSSGAYGPVIVFSTVSARGSRVWLLRAKSKNSYHAVQLSREEADATRPTVGVSSNRVVAAWDEHSEGYAVVVASGTLTGPMEEIGRFASREERWLAPSIVARTDETTYLAWLSLVTVEDDLGVVDRAPFVEARVISSSGTESLAGPSTDSCGRFLDLRDGSLPIFRSKGYLGRRRDFSLRMVGEDVWCFWESRPESTGTSVAGSLLGAKVGGAATVSIHSGGYAYAVAPVNGSSAGTDSIAVGYLDFSQQDETVPQVRMIEIAHANRIPQTDPSPERFGRWRVRSDSPRIPGKRERLSVDNRELGIYWADTHVHSNFSADAEGEIDELITYARDIAALDAVCIIDNDYYPHKALTEPEWRIKNDYSARYTRDGSFVAFPGYEFTFHRRDLDPTFNHRTVVFPRPGGKLVRRIDPGIDSERAFYAALDDANAMCYPHHPTFDLVNPAHEWNVEVTSSWRVCIEECDFVPRLLQAGHRLGFIGSSDQHRCVPGEGGALTAVYATDLTPEALFEAYRARRLVATQGARPFIDFRANGAFIGGETVADRTVYLRGVVRADRPIARVDLIRSGRTLHTIRPNSNESSFEFEDIEDASGVRYYFLRVRLNGDPSFNADPARNLRTPLTLNSRYPHNLCRAQGVFAWTSPIWVTPAPR